MNDMARSDSGNPDFEDDPWRARCRLPGTVGTFAAAMRDAAGLARILLFDDGTACAIPSDLARASWDRLCPGDLVFVRFIPSASGLPIAGAVDSLDGSIQFFSHRAWAAARRERAGPGL